MPSLGFYVLVSRREVSFLVNNKILFYSVCRKTTRECDECALCKSMYTPHHVCASMWFMCAIVRGQVRLKQTFLSVWLGSVRLIALSALAQTGRAGWARSSCSWPQTFPWSHVPAQDWQQDLTNAPWSLLSFCKGIMLFFGHLRHHFTVYLSDMCPPPHHYILPQV